ncbi:glycogen/starch/alpha-glucan phosphorylase [Parasphaerochaeta coccoides]|uniref:Alpha-1,4 glucan phosphorylase n=1 Tax=Parasphaerochaeta coccoides (strain ATCC BAA-1237 / DSM 17374 / SPN1) TaxID=760011 RepID=F4GKR5_PARC1|nr:glycogen/starch/alpha-glucan phosphorylase [Parasphaerochaeta coccoides]AEC01474.1 glycogen phosphorylase [Parasphaerochaeta coccoides DSM 17374]
MADTHTRYGHTEKDIAQDFAEHLKYSQDADLYHTTDQNRYTALALAIRDRIIHQWGKSRKTQRTQNARRVYYLSLEFLMGRAMTNNIINLGLEDETRQALSSLGYAYEELADQEPDAGLGNGGLGRLAACFLDSLATLQIPAYGYGIRYNYGIFRQQIKGGWQVEQPDNWLRDGNPWELPRPDIVYPVQFGGEVRAIREAGKDIYRWIGTETVNGMAYDMPIVGYGGNTINTLRLWSAKAANEFNFSEFNDGDYTEAVRSRIQAETLSQVLYPNDTRYLGKELRLKQQYFFVACSLRDIINRFKRQGASWDTFPSFAAIQMNDTHPSLAVAELMRILVDLEGIEWDAAWEITQAALGYTNHTLMPEALEKWTVPMFQSLLPRHMQIVYEINYRFLQKAVSFFPMRPDLIGKVSIIEESNPKQVRMANLAIVGSHSTNGVAELHSQLLKSDMFPEFNIIFPERFNNKTNGITQRRWLLAANPALASLITAAIGDRWIRDFSRISDLAPFAEDAGFRDRFDAIKKQAKIHAASFLASDCGATINPDTLFDVQIKRIHEYKRQLLNALNILAIYVRLKDDPQFRASFQPTTFLFGGKAAPGYVNAKLIIKFINNIATVIQSDSQVSPLLSVLFMPNYRVTMAESIIPAANISEQISLAGTEASGTGNMKFMCNGALTIGTMDGANVEIAAEAGRDNIFIFGHTEEEITSLKATYSPREWVDKNPLTRHVVELLDSGYINVNEPAIFAPLRRSLFEEGDRYMLFADMGSYVETHDKVRTLYAENRTEWNRKAILNIAASGKFSSDRTIMEYAQDIWNAKPCPVELDDSGDTILKDAGNPVRSSGGKKKK